MFATFILLWFWVAKMLHVYVDGNRVILVVALMEVIFNVSTGYGRCCEAVFVVV